MARHNYTSDLEWRQEWRESMKRRTLSIIEDLASLRKKLVTPEGAHSMKMLRLLYKFVYDWLDKSTIDTLTCVEKEASFNTVKFYIFIVNDTT